MLIAQALPRTQRIKLCPGAHLLPYHHPIELAHRVAFLDQLAQGRYMLGVGISALPSDLALFGVDAAAGENRRMTLEALEIMLRVWRGEPFSFDGEFWKVRPPKSDFDFLKLHLKPYQKPHPPIGIAGLSPGSETLKLAGERGFIPLSISLNPAHTASHWTSVEAGAARQRAHAGSRASGGSCARSTSRATDDEAKKRVREGAHGPLLARLPAALLRGQRHGPAVPGIPSHSVEKLDVDYLIEHSWFVGSPRDRDATRSARLQRATGGFGGAARHDLRLQQRAGAGGTSRCTAWSRRCCPISPTSQRFEGRVAFVTGAASGIGRATALRLAPRARASSPRDRRRSAARRDRRADPRRGRRRGRATASTSPTPPRAARPSPPPSRATGGSTCSRTWPA